mmetsp:Transcript_40748/g.41335  ORF Transcript_40748/g.41335 Transcript_40748/m.41335 type:complete len:91 (+) Transcript_40748:243-515(+)
MMVIKNINLIGGRKIMIMIQKKIPLCFFNAATKQQKNVTEKTSYYSMGIMIKEYFHRIILSSKGKYYAMSDDYCIIFLKEDPNRYNYYMI